MILGKILLALTFLSFLSSTIYYLFNERSPSVNYARNSRAFFLLGAGLILSTVVLLFFLIFSHQFQYSFVYSYSSKGLPSYFLFSTFWAGQAGTFLMWGLFTSLYGIVVMKFSSKYNNIVLAITASVIAFLAILTIKVNPFEYIWITDPQQFLPGQIPIDGRGLNPLLQDYWMVIHPPVLFVGYSSTLMPFAFAISRMFKGQEKEYVGIVQPWALFNLLILGTGIIMGGYWAYTTLGWGGYWAWDPVENSSLVPWLFMLAFVHGIFVEKRKEAFVKSNIIFGALPFLAMLYGSFLTRSGVLADFSVHSFIDQGINVFLVAFMVIYFVLFIVSSILKLNSFNSQRLENAFFNQETFISYGILLTTVFGILIFVGTSSPLITSLLSEKPANVSLEYYYIISTSIIVVMLALIGITPYFPWGKKAPTDLMTYFISSIVLSAIITAVFALFSLTKPVSIILVFMSLFTLLLNSNLLYARSRKNLLKAGGFWAHVGLSLMIIGIVSSSMYGDTYRVAIPENGSESVKGFTFNYYGIQNGDWGHDYAKVEVTGNNTSFTAKPKFYYSEFTRSYMNTPHVQNFLTHDLYIAPLQIISGEDMPEGKQINISKGDSLEVDGMKIKMEKFSMERLDNDGTIAARVHLIVQIDGNEYKVEPEIRVSGGERILMPAKIDYNNLEFNVTSINVNERKATVYINDEKIQDDKTSDYLVLEVSEKPLIIILWIGTLILIFGIFLAFQDKRKLLLKKR